MAEQLICNQQVVGSTPITSSNRGEFPSGQRGQTVNLLAVPSVVRIHLLPPKEKELLSTDKSSFFFFNDTFIGTRYTPLVRENTLRYSEGNERRHICAAKASLSASIPAKHAVFPPTYSRSFYKEQGRRDRPPRFCKYLLFSVDFSRHLCDNTRRYCNATTFLFGKGL